jgi:catechol 2,3-dioxygenase-like lactoylglutathione lyase family enzyme
MLYYLKKGKNMKFVCSMICVKDINKSRNIYEGLFGLKVKFDCGLSIQEDFFKLAGIPENDIKYKTNNFEIYFKEEYFDGFLLRLKEYKNIEFVHDIIEYHWGQQVIRIYDLDKHIIEIGENMNIVIKRFIKNGL